MKKMIITIFLILIAVLGLFIYRLINYTYITVKFKELRPCECTLPVYYKGIAIGKAKEKKHSDDYTFTLVKVVLYPKKLLLPVNTEVLLKKEKKRGHEKDFLELIYPKDPSKDMIADGSVLNGRTTVDFVTFLANQDPESLEQIKQNLTTGSENLSIAFSSLADLFTTLQSAVEENRSGLKKSSSNLAQTTDNFNQISSKFNKALKQESLNNGVSNLEAATGNIDQSTKNFQVITGNLNGTTNSINEVIPRIDSALYQAQGTLCNMNEITCGVKETLKKRFGGWRILFGKTISPKKTECCRP